MQMSTSTPSTRAVCDMGAPCRHGVQRSSLKPGLRELRFRCPAHLAPAGRPESGCLLRAGGRCVPWPCRAGLRRWRRSRLRAGASGRGDPGNWVWAFSLVPDGEGTRLLSRNRIATADVSRLGRALNTYVMEPGSLIMERKMLFGIKDRAERLVHADVGSQPPTGCDGHPHASVA